MITNLFHKKYDEFANIFQLNLLAIFGCVVFNEAKKHVREITAKCHLWVSICNGFSFSGTVECVKVERIHILNARRKMNGMNKMK